MKESRSEFHSIRGLRYHVRVWGDAGAPRLFMLHGWMDVAASFQFLVDSLSRDWHVIAPDWRGFGLSEWRPEGYWFPDYYADLEALLDLYQPGAPVLLVGAHGTAKSLLVEKLAGALGLVFRHYNASLVSYDDLVGIPMPAPEGAGLRFVGTEGAIWGAGFVFLDEISRCRPELQNKLFPLIHERRVAGLDLPDLRQRWAAMNPPAPQGEGAEDAGGPLYLGSEALDAALADRFAFVLRVPCERERAVPRLPRVRGPLITKTTVGVPLTGRVVGPGDLPLAGVSVELPSLQLSVRTDADGWFRFANVPPSPARLTVRAKGEVQTFVAPQSSGEPLTIRFHLKEG